MSSGKTTVGVIFVGYSSDAKAFFDKSFSLLNMFAFQWAGVWDFEIVPVGGDIWPLPLIIVSPSPPELTKSIGGAIDSWGYYNATTEMGFVQVPLDPYGNPSYFLAGFLPIIAHEATHATGRLCHDPADPMKPVFCPVTPP